MLRSTDLIRGISSALVLMVLLGFLDVEVSDGGGFGMMILFSLLYGAKP